MGNQASRAIAFIEAIGLLDLISNCIKSHRIASNRIESSSTVITQITQSIVDRQSIANVDRQLIAVP